MLIMLYKDLTFISKMYKNNLKTNFGKIMLIMFKDGLPTIVKVL